MFGDGKWVSVEEESSNYYEWRGKVENLLKEDSSLKITILEIGRDE